MAVRSSLQEAFVQANSLGGPLRERLVAYQASQQELSPVVAKAYDRLVERIVHACDLEDSPGVGDEMPDFLLPSDDGGLTGRTKVLERGPAIISFNRGHWCSFCRLELFSLARLYPEIERLGGCIVSIVPERQKFALELKSRCALPFPLLLDIDNSLGLELGLVISVGEELRSLYQARNFDLQDFQGVGSWLLPVPATYVVDQAGIIRAKFADPDFRRRMEPDDMLAAMVSVRAD